MMNFIVAIAIIGAVVWHWPDYDATDDIQNQKRSGMTIKVDFETKCQYLSSYGLFGLGASLTPRLDSEGKPMCEETRYNDNTIQYN